jgi:hypothetical protein
LKSSVKVGCHNESLWKSVEIAAGRRGIRRERTSSGLKGGGSRESRPSKTAKTGAASVVVVFANTRKKVGQPSHLELEVSRSSARTAFGARGWEQTHHAPQILPRGLVQGWVCADQVADHLPGGDVECAFRRRAEGQRD